MKLSFEYHPIAIASTKAMGKIKLFLLTHRLNICLSSKPRTSHSGWTIVDPIQFIPI